MRQPQVDSDLGGRLRQRLLARLNDERGEVPAAASLTTVTLEGSDGRRRDHSTLTSPIFGRRSLPPAVTWKRALRVKRIACRLSLLDRNRGGTTVSPFRFPDTDAKKFR